MILILLFLTNSLSFSTITSFPSPHPILLFFPLLYLLLEFCCLYHKLQTVTICRLQAQPPRHVKVQPFSQKQSSVADKLTECTQTVEFQQIVPTYISPAGTKVVGCIGMMSMEFTYTQYSPHPAFPSFFLFLFA